MHSLEPLFGLADYGRLFCDVQLWTPYVHQVCAAHGLNCGVVECPTPGSFPTFSIDRRWVVKFFGPLLDGAHCFAIEQAIGRLLARQPLLPAAPLLAEGCLFVGDARWEWPYLIFEFIEGDSIGTVFEHLSLAEKLATAERLGGWVRALHSLPLPMDGPFETDWGAFARFLAAQRAGCTARHAAWGSLPPGLAAEADVFLPSVGDFTDLIELPHLIHADLTGDHLLGCWQPTGWQAGALIDFGDARTGSLYYELAALQLSLFRGDRRLLAAFLSAYGFNPPPDFARQALAGCLLHQFNVFAEQPAIVRSARSLTELAERLFGV